MTLGENEARYRLAGLVWPSNITLSIMAALILCLLCVSCLVDDTSKSSQEKTPQPAQQPAQQSSGASSLNDLLSQKQESTSDISEGKRKAIWHDLSVLQLRASKEADDRFPLDPTQDMKVGQSFVLSQQTPLMPELDPEDPIAALQLVKQLAPGASIYVRRVAHKELEAWYYVEAKSASGASLGVGWINSTALIGQSHMNTPEQTAKRGVYEDSLNEKYKQQVAKKYHVTTGQVDAIESEGIEKDWPSPEEK
jgi:hypothetical protein